MYMPKMGGGAVFKPSMNMRFAKKVGMKGSGVGSFLLDGGRGGQSSYSSIDDYVATTDKAIGGSGVASSLAKVGGKISGLVIKKESSRPKRQNINFSL